MDKKKLSLMASLLVEYGISKELTLDAVTEILNLIPEEREAALSGLVNLGIQRAFAAVEILDADIPSQVEVTAAVEVLDK